VNTRGRRAEGDLRPAPVAQRWLTKGRERLGRCRQDQEVRQSAQPTIRNPLRPPQCHHNPVAVPGVQWRPTGIDDLHKPLRFGPRCLMAVNRRIRDGSENHGVPGSNPGPATHESPANSGKIKYPNSAAGTRSQRRVNSRIEKWSLSRAVVACLTYRLWRRRRLQGSSCYLMKTETRSPFGPLKSHHNQVHFQFAEKFR
jgi:hypothetical protein